MTSPILKLSRDPPLSHLISINSGMVEKGAQLLVNNRRHSYHSGNPRGFISYVLGTGDKTTYYFAFFHGPQHIFLTIFGGVDPIQPIMLILSNTFNLAFHHLFYLTMPLEGDTISEN